MALYFLRCTLIITLAMVAGVTSALRMDWLMIDEAQPAPNKDLSQMSRRPLPSRCLQGGKGGSGNPLKFGRERGGSSSPLRTQLRC